MTRRDIPDAVVCAIVATQVALAVCLFGGCASGGGGRTAVEWDYTPQIIAESVELVEFAWHARADAVTRLASAGVAVSQLWDVELVLHPGMRFITGEHGPEWVFPSDWPAHAGASVGGYALDSAIHMASDPSQAGGTRGVSYELLVHEWAHVLLKQCRIEVDGDHDPRFAGVLYKWRNHKGI